MTSIVHEPAFEVEVREQLWSVLSTFEAVRQDLGKVDIGTIFAHLRDDVLQVDIGGA